MTTSVCNETISAAELAERRAKGWQAQLIDVRSTSEFAAGHIPGAINIPMDEIERRIADLEPSVPVVLVCQAGKRAAMTRDLLRQDRSNLIVAEGGTDAWLRLSLPVVASTRSRWSLERQVRLAAGLLVTVAVGLSLLVNQAWIYLAAFVGLGLTFAGLTNICAMASLLALLPWNKPGSSIEVAPQCSAKGDTQ